MLSQLLFILGRSPAVLAICLVLLNFTNCPCALGQQIGAPAGFSPDSDSLKGNLWPARSCFDALYYSLYLDIDIAKRSLSGHCRLKAKLLKPSKVIQLDLARQFVINKIVWLGGSENLAFYRVYDAIFVILPNIIKPNQVFELEIHYQGIPDIAPNPPWQGGFVWQKDRLGRPWVGVACQGIGASSWWPCKDHPSDEPDSVDMAFGIDSGLVCIANGRLVKTIKQKNNKIIYYWHVSNPINLYNITLNIAHYKTIKSNYISAAKATPLTLNFYVLDYNLKKAKRHFKQVNLMLRAYETLFGIYPFWDDGYSLVETNYLGMEHQSGISYGNKYKNNQFGFDFIIIHESGHEYWGNSLSVQDNADLWIHESFCTYTETLYLEKTTSKANALKYLRSQKPKIQNQHPIQGLYGLAYNLWPDADMYYKGAWMLHSLRNMIDNDALFFGALKNMTQHFEKTNVNRQMIIGFLSAQFGRNLDGFFAQYLDFAQPPILDYQLKYNQNQVFLEYRWAAEVATDFPMNAQIRTNTHVYTLRPTHNWQRLTLNTKSKKPITIWPTDRFYYLTRLHP